MDKYIPFPQADDIEKIVSIINISNEDFLSNFDKTRNIFKKFKLFNANSRNYYNYSWRPSL